MDARTATDPTVAISDALRAVIASLEAILEGKDMRRARDRIEEAKRLLAQAEPKDPPARLSTRDEVTRMTSEGGPPPPRKPA